MEDKILKCLAKFFCIVLVSPVCALQNEPIIAERPGFSSSPFTLSPAELQIEIGYQYTHEGGRADFDDHTLPLMLVRMGLVERLELQLGWAGYSWSEAGGRHIDGTNDPSIGIKWQVTEAGTTIPLALFAGLSLPVGEDEFSSGEADPNLGAFWSYSAGLDWFGTVLLSESDGDSSLGNSVGISLPVDNETGAYVEYFGKYGGRGGPEHFLNGGLTYVPGIDMQFDVYAGLGLNSRAADLFVGLGLAYRF